MHRTVTQYARSPKDFAIFFNRADLPDMLSYIEQSNNEPEVAVIEIDENTSIVVRPYTVKDVVLPPVSIELMLKTAAFEKLTKHLTEKLGAANSTRSTGGILRRTWNGPEQLLLTICARTQ